MRGLIVKEQSLLGLKLGEGGEARAHGIADRLPVGRKPTRYELLDVLPAEAGRLDAHEEGLGVEVGLAAAIGPCLQDCEASYELGVERPLRPQVEVVDVL